MNGQKLGYKVLFGVCGAGVQAVAEVLQSGLVLRRSFNPTAIGSNFLLLLLPPPNHILVNMYFLGIYKT